MFQHIEAAYLFLLVSSVLIVIGVLILLFLKYRQTYLTREKERLHRKHKEYVAYVLAHLDADQPLEMPVGPLEKLDLIVLEELLIEIAERVKGKHRMKVGELFEKLGLPELEISRLQQLPGPMRSDAAYKLGAMGYEKATPALFAAWESEKDEAGRYIIARAIARCTKTMADLRKMVENMIACGADSPRLLAELLQDSPLDLQPLLREWMTSEDHRFVLVSLACLPATAVDEGWTECLWRQVQSVEKEVRIQSAKRLLTVDELAADRIQALLTHPDWEIRALIVKAIGGWQKESYVPELLAAIEDENWWVKYHAARSLVRVGENGFRALCEIAARTTRKETADLALQLIQEALREERSSLASAKDHSTRRTIYNDTFQRQQQRVIS